MQVASPGDLANAIGGALFVAIGLIAAMVALSARPRREPMALWFGVFCLMYGVRLLSKSPSIRALTPWPVETFHYADAFITYAILVPAGRFAEALVGPGWHHLVRRTWQVACGYVVVGVVNDLARGQPFATMWLNPPILVAWVVIYVAHIFARPRTGPWPSEVRAVAGTAGIFIVVAIYETVSPRGLLGPAGDAEPITMLLFAAALGWFVLVRAREQAFAFVALSRELELAREIQRSLLPRHMPRTPGLRIRGLYLPMSAVAGDFYDVEERRGGRVVVIVADVSGHGVPAALVASMVKVAFAVESERFERPGDILGAMNRALTGMFDRAYITACCVAIDRADRRVAYAAAGHPPALLLRASGQIERLTEGGIVLTFLPDASYETADVRFEPGDRLLLFTDGLLEAAQQGGDEFFGDAQLDRVVSALPASADMLQEVEQAHRMWIGVGTPLSDDVTLVAVECVQA